MPKTYAFAQDILQHIIDEATYTAPATLYVALFTEAPTRSGGGTEVDGTGYARQAITFSSPTAQAEMSNDGAITFPEAQADWGTIVAFAVFDADTSGNMLGYDYLTQSREVLTGDTLYFASGNLVWNES